MAKTLRPKPTPTPSIKDAPKQYRAFAFLVYVCNWTRTEAYQACFPNSKSIGQSLNSVASHFGKRDDINAIVEEIDLYEVRNFIDAKIAQMEKNANSFVFAKTKPIAQSQPAPDSNDILSMTDEELMDNAVKLYQSAADADKQLQALKLITDLKKKLGGNVENEADTSVARYYVPTTCETCNLYKTQKSKLQLSDSQ